jgi:hypothetical protein
MDKKQGTAKTPSPLRRKEAQSKSLRSLYLCGENPSLSSWQFMDKKP